MNGTIYTTKRRGTDGGTMKPWIDGRGYPSIRLMINGKPQIFKVHRLVADSFLPNPKSLPFINHKDGNKQNYKPSNLEWCTSSENMIHAWKTGLRKEHSSSGERFIYLCKTTNRWRVIIGLEGKKHRLGRFDTIEQAKQARDSFIGSLLGV